ncbi:MAG: NAD-dependent epimerase/dehydratase family protein [Chromatiales bacterium]|nr:NAD-dependent epimerase/dehydratase family protein [Chromatiales bacterium]
MDALVIGGSGPTGPSIVNGLVDRGYRVSVLNRGLHDAPEIPATVERIVGDPHFPDTLSEALSRRQFDLVVATYGRIRHVAAVLASHTDRLITVGGGPGLRGSRQPELLFPRGQQTPLPEDAPKVATRDEFNFGYLARISEDAVMERHAAGDYVATHLRYPLIYGPRQLRPAEWQVIKRVLDGRRLVVLPDSGLTLITRGYSLNMAQAILLAVDKPEAASGQIYNCGDVHQFTLAQWVEAIAQTMDTELEVISVPGALAYPARNFMISRKTSHHQLFDMHKIRAELGYVDNTEPLAALVETVKWYIEHPPEESAQECAQREQHYRTEDAMAQIYADSIEALAAVEYIDPDYEHPYAHPTRPGEKDHRGR